jgi:hypothetical protein
MYQELMDEKFPGKEKITTEIELTFRRKAIQRVWQHIKTTVNKTKQNCFVMLSSYDIRSVEYEGTSLLKEIDYLQSEYVDIQGMQEASKYIGQQTKQIFCTANAKDQNSFLELVADAVKHKIGTNDFARANNDSLKPPISHYLSKPIDHFTESDFHIAVLARVYNNLPLDYVNMDKK